MNMNSQRDGVDINLTAQTNYSATPTTPLLFNKSDLSSLEDGCSLLDKYSRNRAVEGAPFYWLVVCYFLLIVLGATGNSLVVCAVVRKRTMRTARNLFIVNLAVSDLLLCLVTMPLTLMEVVAKYWPLGKESALCKMLGALQALSIFVSTLSITAIALDRYHVIVYPTRENLKKLGAVLILVFIWVSSLILASPMLMFRELQHHAINLPGLPSISFCVELWPVEHGRAYYSAFSLVFQYLLPIITVTVAYSRICRKLRYRYVNTSLMGPPNANAQHASSTRARKAKDDQRMKRTNALLYSIVLIFCVSWLPLNFFNLIVDIWNPFSNDECHQQTMLVTYAVCHMMGMSSACSNPLLYGWLNDNFRKEFLEIAAALCPCVSVAAVRERVGSLRSSLVKRRGRAPDSTRLSNAFTADDGRSGMDSRHMLTEASAQPDTELTMLTRPSTVDGAF